MERLFRISNEAMRRVPARFHRYLYDEIDWNNRLIGISGARGSGKTIMLLQRLKVVTKEALSLYVTLDDVYFTENRLVYFVEEFEKQGGQYLFLDEVHKYPNWSQELKNIYDFHPNLKIVFSSSSILEIFKGSHDLSRRALVFNLPGMSFREYLLLVHKIDIDAISLEYLLAKHEAFSSHILNHIKPIPLFIQYLKEGYYPFVVDTGRNYIRQLMNTINTVLEVDMPAIHHIDYHSALKIKKLLSIIAHIVPYKPNIEKLARQTDLTRPTLLKYLSYLDRAQIIKLLSTDPIGINYLNKPEKVFLQNTNIAYALADLKVDKGNIRETFFLNQLSARHQVTYPKRGDFLVDEKYLFEVGGKNKTNEQIKDEDNVYIAADDIEYGFRNKIPLWMFGFLY
ncbi:MAG: AAA family ATPase [Salinivirgaceae bacterium]